MRQNAAISDRTTSADLDVILAVTNLITLGQIESAVKLLLNTDSSEPSFYENSLMACLLAAGTDSSASQSTVKLVATNLIANARISEGCLLLCLIGKASDACRYLQSYGMHERAVEIARVTVASTPVQVTESATSTQSPNECDEVMMKYAEHLLTSVECSNKVGAVLGSFPVQLQTQALYVYISIGEWTKVIELLQGQRLAHLAAMVIGALNEAYKDAKVPVTIAQRTSVANEYRQVIESSKLAATIVSKSE